jgi:hypothetical protein
MGMKLSHNQSKTGFTVIEVILFFAISGFLIVGLLLGVSSSIARQRYQDSVQDLADFLKTQYLAVSNPTLPQWNGADLLDYTAAAPGNRCNFTGHFTGTGGEETLRRGQSNCQLFGKLIVFGENGEQNRVNTYLVIGMEGRRGALTGNPIADLKVSDIFVPALHFSESYTIPYSAMAEDIPANAPLSASMLIVRPPRSGSVRTLLVNEAIDVTDIWNALRASGEDPTGRFFPDDLMNRMRNTGDLTICVGSDDVFAIGGRRRAIRVQGDGGNASAVEVVAAGETPCE